MLAAVDCAVMLVDAAKGLETQTMKLFEVCKQRNLPIITVINKWDRPGLDALALMDEITERTGLLPMPLTWAVGIAGDFRGVLGPAQRQLRPVPAQQRRRQHRPHRVLHPGGGGRQPGRRLVQRASTRPAW